ncbi:hypothetical protein C8R47DRAFT_1071115 [Mycena vitilis]|nr:hypothetical protein C8R47DRAFT_1071115 [Mycena vitilis]
MAVNRESDSVQRDARQHRSTRMTGGESQVFPVRDSRKMKEEKEEGRDKKRKKENTEKEIGPSSAVEGRGKARTQGAVGSQNVPATVGEMYKEGPPMHDSKAMHKMENMSKRKAMLERKDTSKVRLTDQRIAPSGRAPANQGVKLSSENSASMAGVRIATWELRHRRKREDGGATESRCSHRVRRRKRPKHGVCDGCAAPGDRASGARNVRREQRRKSEREMSPTRGIWDVAQGEAERGHEAEANKKRGEEKWSQRAVLRMHRCATIEGQINIIDG